MMKGKNTLSTLGYIALGVIVAISINFGMSFLLHTDIPVVAVESNSMVPTFAEGDILILSGANLSNLKIGDIIVYDAEGQAVPIVHRIIAKNADGSFQTLGDANHGRQNDFEKHVDISKIHGMVVFMVPYIGWIKIGISSALVDYIIPNIVWIIIAAVVALAAVYALKYIKRSDKI
jgi:signal peptidase I